MAQRILGLDLGAYSVKAAILEGTFRGYTVAAFEEVRLAPHVEGAPPLSSLQAALAELAGRLGALKADLTATALPGAQAATPLVSLPFLDSKKIEATLAGEVEGLIPFDISEVIHDHQVLAQRDGKSELLVAVARQDDLRELLGVLHAAGVDPRVVTVAGMAYPPLLAELAARSPLPADEAVAVLDIGHARTTLVIATGGGNGAPPVVLFSRTFSGGGAELTTALEREFQVPRAEAEAWKEKDGDLSEGAADQRAAAALQRGLLPVLREVRQSLRAAQARTRRPVTTLHVCGGTSRLPGLTTLLARDLAMKVVPLQALSAEDQTRLPAAAGAVIPLAVGLALRAQSRGGKLVNLRKGEFAFKGDLDYLKGKVARLVAFAAVLLLLIGGNVFAHSWTLKRTEQALDAALCSVTQKVLKSCETDFNVALSKLQGGDTKASQIPTASALEIFVEATQRLPADVPVKIQEVEVTLQKLKLRGVVDSFDGVDQVVAGLKRSACFGEIRRGRVQKNREEKIEFTLDVLYVCGQNADKAG